MTDDVRWWVPASSEAHAGIARPLVGRDAVSAMLGGAGAWYAELHWRIDHLVAEGDLVAVTAHMDGVTTSGKPYSGDYAFLYRLVDGRIAEVWEHADTAYAYAQTAG